MREYDNDWFKTVLDAMSDMVLVKGPRSQLLWANRAFLDYYGMTEAQLVDIVDAEHSDPDDTLQYVIDDQTVFDTQEDLDVPQEAVTDAQGNARLFHTVKSPIFEASEVVRSVGVSRPLENTDIQRRDISHDDAKAFVAPLQSVTKSFPNPMLMVDVKARVINSSPLWDDTFGSPGASPNGFFDEIYASMHALSRKIQTCLTQRQNQHVTFELDQPNRKRQVFTIQISPWAFSDGSLGGAIVIATDVSDVHERTDALQKANGELVQYSYRASHDLKGPISTVKGLAAFIAEDIEDGNYEEAVENAQCIATLMNQLESNVVSILDLARSDLKDDDTSDIDLEVLMKGICDGLAAHIAQLGVKVQCDLRVRHLNSQPARVRQIVENLVANAIKYHAPERDHRYVKVTTRESDSGITITVEDNGQGIPEDSQHTIFKPFSRLNSDSEGSGLGLAIVKNHVDTLAGSISVASGEDGTTFCVQIPREIDMSTKK